MQAESSSRAGPIGLDGVTSGSVSVDSGGVVLAADRDSFVLLLCGGSRGLRTVNIAIMRMRLWSGERLDPQSVVCLLILNSVRCLLWVFGLVSHPQGPCAPPPAAAAAVAQALKQTTKQATSQACKQTHKQTTRQTSKQTNKQTSKQTIKRTNQQTHDQPHKHTNKHPNKQPAKQANKHTNKQTQTSSHTN